MKIRPYNSSNVIDIYAIYWSGKDTLFWECQKDIVG